MEVFLVLEPYFLVLEISFLVEVSENMVQVRIFFINLEKKSKKALVALWWNFGGSQLNFGARTVSPSSI